MAWPSGLGGVEGRGRASTHGAFLWVGGCRFFGAGRGGSLVGGDRGQGWTGLRAWEE